MVRQDASTEEQGTQIIGAGAKAGLSVGEVVGGFTMWRGSPIRAQAWVHGGRNAPH